MAERRWFQFSLRTLMIAVMLSASVGLCWQHWKVWAETKWSLAPIQGYEHEYSMSRVALSPDGKRLLTLWAESEVHGGAFEIRLPDGSRKVVQQGPGHPAVPATIQVFDTRSGMQIWSFSERAAGNSFSFLNGGICFSPGGRWICFGRHDDGRMQATSPHADEWNVRIFNAATGKGPVYCPGLIEAARRSWELPADDWQTKPNRHLDNPILGSGPITESILFSNDDSMLAIWFEGITYVFDPETGRELHTFKGWPLSFSPNNQWIALSDERTAQARGISTGDVSPFRPIKTHESDCISVSNVGVCAAHPKTKNEALVDRIENAWHNDGTRLTAHFDNDKIPNCITDGYKVVLSFNEGFPSGSSISASDDAIAMSATSIVHLWTLRRPYQWWGIFYFYELWLTLIIGCALCWSVLHDRSSGATLP